MTRPLIYALSLLMLFCHAAAATDADRWHDGFYTYRLRLSTGEAVDGHVRLDLSKDAVIDHLQQVAIDPLNIETLAFEKSVLVDPATGEVAGGFRLIPANDPMSIDGLFENLGTEKSSWHGYDNTTMSMEPVTLDGTKLKALWVVKDKIENLKLSQTVDVTPGKLYLLEYWVYMDADEYAISVGLYDPRAKIFAELDSSYVPKLTPRGVWTRQRVIVKPHISDPELRIATAYRGRCGVAGVSLREVDLVLDAELSSPTRLLELYCVARAGHRLTQPDMVPGSTVTDITTVPVESVRADRIELNPDGVLLKGEAADLWTVPSYLPLRSKDLRSYQPPDTGTGFASISVPIGGAATLIIAVDTKTPHAVFDQLSSDLPLDVTIERLAEVPVYDGPVPYGKLMEHRFDPRVPLNWPLIPASTTGVHLLSVTMTASIDTKPGTYQDTLVIDVTTQEPRSQRFDLPIKVQVLPVTVKPMNHFGTQFAGQHFMVRYEQQPYFTYPGKSVSDFHGLGRDDANPDSVAALTSPDQPYDELPDVKELAGRYFHKMIDHYLLPQTPMVYSNYEYTIVDRGEGKAPALKNWSFTDYDIALDEFVISRDLPWFAVFHANGHTMHYLRLSNGVHYSYEESPDESLKWVRLPKDEFYNLLGDYFEGIASHLYEKGVIDRTLYIIDECSPDTFRTIHDYIQAVRTRPHAKRIKFGFTSYQTSQYTLRDDDGKLLLSKVLDVPMPDNDEHFNFLETEWNARQDPKPPHQWVYYVETDHFVLEQAGISTVVTPLKLGHFGVDGWYCWASFIWHMPYEHTEQRGFKYPNGPTVNPWLNPYNHHGHGVMTFFWPPDPRGLPPQPTDLVVPSYRLALMRDGIQLRALQEILKAGRDDTGREVFVNEDLLKQFEDAMNRLWADNPVQWYLSYDVYREAVNGIHESGSNN